MKPGKKNPQPNKPAASYRKDEVEPTASSGPIPVWIFVVLGVFIFWGEVYLDSYGGGFNSHVYAPYRSYKELEALVPKDAGGAFAAQGKEVFGKSCILCHQATGLGTPGQFPPLAGSEWVLAQGPNRIIRIVLNGLQGPVQVKGVGFEGAMTPWRDTFTDTEIAAVITYVRNEWGNKAPPVKPEEVKAIRDETKDMSGSWTAPEILKVPEGP